MERVQKILARAGYGSRRACEELIINGRVRINDDKAILGSKADPVRDKIFVDNHLIQLPKSFTYIAIYKPRGVLSAVTSTNHKTVRDLIDIRGHIFPVGRLDFDSEGLMLLTNDGELTNKLTHPRYGHKKEYRVLVARRPDQEQLDAWRRGVVLPDGNRSAPAKVVFNSTYGKGAWLQITMREGRKRQIREIGSLLGLPVVRIIRIRISTLHLGRLKPGEWRYLTPEEIESVKKSS
jgi:23S rRNA pseudouridine2605 synthase